MVDGELRRSLGCRFAVNTLNALADQSGGRFAIAVVLSGPTPAVRSFLTLFPLRVPVVSDPSHTIAGEFAIHLAPSGLIYDAGGRLVRSGTISELEPFAELAQSDGTVPLGPTSTLGGH